MPFVPLPGDFTKLMRSAQGLALMQGKPVRLISDALLGELLETTVGATRRLLRRRRDRLGLKPLPWGGAQSRRTPPAHLVDPQVLHLISPPVLPRPAAWKASASLPGFCFLQSRSGEGAILPTPYSPDRDLADFLQNGPAPFYAGFGSMICREPEALAALVVEAAQLAVPEGAGRDSPRWRRHNGRHPALWHPLDSGGLLCGSARLGTHA